MNEIIVVGGGLAGAEAAWQAARTGFPVRLYEMRPLKMTPAHHTGMLAELVCSNSLRAASLENAVGLLKEEMRRFHSLIMTQADLHAVPAGGALAVDREAFAAGVTAAIKSHPLIQVIHEEIRDIPDCTNNPVIIATGPLTSDALAGKLAALTGQDALYFYDAAAPIVTADSIDYSRVFKASRYDKGNAAYLNCPLNEEEYARFYQALVTAEVHYGHLGDEDRFFEGCMPIEVLAARGYDTLRFGPLKPVGLKDPKTGKMPYAVVQLRQDNAAGTLYNMVGFQTRLRQPEQKRVFRLIPGLERAEFVRYGMMHRNTYINSPALLRPTLQFRSKPHLFFAGQMTGVEGYVESAGMGLIAGINAARLAAGKPPLVWPPETALGALAHYITTPHEDFQPMNVNFGLFPPFDGRVPKKERKRDYARRALAAIDGFIKENLI